MAKRSTGARFNLGEPWDSDLADFCEANFGAPATEIVRRAVKAFIDNHLEDEPALRERFHEARKKRLGANGDNIKLLTPNDGR